MVTYQDLLKVGTDENKRMEFVYGVIAQHKTTDAYKNAVIADEYDKQRNRTIVNYQKLLYTMSGEKVPDNYSANYKLCSNFFNRFVTQQNQYLLSNGVTWENDATSDKLGKDLISSCRKQRGNPLSAVLHSVFGISIIWNPFPCVSLRRFMTRKTGH